MPIAKSAPLAAFLLTLVAAAVSPEHLLVLATGLTFVIGMRLLWSPLDTPLLILPFALQGLQVAVKPIQTALTGQPLQDFSDFGTPLAPAAWLGLAGVAAFGLGLWLGRGRARFDWSATLKRDLLAARPELMAPRIALVLIVLGHLFDVTGLAFPSARQLFVALAEVRAAGLFLITYWCLVQGRALLPLAALLAVEIVIGMTGFFAEFRITLFAVLVGAAAARPNLRFREFLGFGALVTLALALGVFWSAIKTDYREFLNQGTHTQAVYQPLDKRLNYVGRAADEFDTDGFRVGTRNLVARESYIDFLSATLAHVPDAVPFERGQRLGDALLNMIQPRILFPDKPPTPDDSVVTAKYTGLHTDRSKGASISIGWLGELYIDFGKLGAVIGAFVIGLMGGAMFRVIRSYRGVPLYVSMALGVMLMLQFISFETDLVRSLGAAVTTFLVCLVLQRLVAPQVLASLLVHQPRPET